MTASQFTRGGPKPQMLGAGARVLSITVGGGMVREGLYEIGSAGNDCILARLVELPLWLSDRAKALRDDATLKGDDRSVHRFILGAPAAALIHTTPDSKGHILLTPRNAGVVGDGPMVGLDWEIYQRVLAEESIRHIEFHVFRAGYVRHEVWRISRADFLAHCREVKPSKLFMRQMMVPVAKTKRIRNG